MSALDDFSTRCLVDGLRVVNRLMADDDRTFLQLSTPEELIETNMALGWLVMAFARELHGERAAAVLEGMQLEAELALTTEEN
jgi:hypothetical protein